MQTSKHPIQVGNQVIDFVKLPDVARQELVTFSEFFVFKYQGQMACSQHEKHAILKVIFQEAKGKLPVNYAFFLASLHLFFDSRHFCA